MSTENYSLEKKVQYAVRRTVCDICSRPVANGQIKLRLVPTREHWEGDCYPFIPILKAAPAELRDIDICSVECLVSNAQGIALLLNAKIIPNIPENPTDRFTGVATEEKSR